MNIADIPLALYIHIPWCVKKCPYCDFNSHALPNGVDNDLQQQYLQALLADFVSQVDFIQQRKIESIFIGGGTPSLISAAGYQWLFAQLRRHAEFSADCEITMEANPGTLEHAPFADYLQAGINRLSIGVQSFDDEHLQRLGRIHRAEQARQAIQQAQAAGFRRINVDLMHGLPQQQQAQALSDLQTAVDCGATHISWYQLTIEPNTVFYRTQPQLPDDDTLADIQYCGEKFLLQQGFKHYEVSAWTAEQPCRHNLNYWQFGDYLAIGAGAYGKITRQDGIYRFHKTRMPKDYLAKTPAEHLHLQAVSPEELPFEFMMNALRLLDGVPYDYFYRRTGLDENTVKNQIVQLQKEQLLVANTDRLQCTVQGMNFLNDVLQRFLS